ncbi:hypothetical protein B0H63DRAFT_481624 [Podospora didyma]|uniref:Uncharacterized protein n=1 Tax=Podospora didyma TaxID=330526 RepID=A0AAE0KFQ6_9PEZI|nr:hypothetical protein B0H63DRAFT_481624 [Podospora didyma]
MERQTAAPTPAPIATAAATQPWTATRCHRLLRPLLAHVASLRKERAWKPLSGHDETRISVQVRKSGDKPVQRKYSTKRAAAAAARKLGGLGTRTGHGNLTTPPRHLPRRQASNRSPHHAALPTPFLRRIRDHQFSSPGNAVDEPEPAPLLPMAMPSTTTAAAAAAATTGSRCYHSGAVCGSRCTFELEFSGFRAMTEPEIFTLYESVFRAFDSLLRATCPRRNRVAGPRSLLALCLRKVPEYVAELEYWDEKDADENGTKSALNDSQVSFEVYSELEALGAVDGWHHLCLVVRAHGVRVIQEAVSDDLLDDAVADLLIRLCREYMPVAEFSDLVDSFVLRRYPRPVNFDQDLFACRDLQPLQTLRKFEASEAPPLLLDRLARLLSSGLLPVDWILTKSFSPLWTLAARRLGSKRPCQDAADFIISSIEMLCRLVSSGAKGTGNETVYRAQQALVRAVGALGSMVLLGHEGSRASVPAARTSNENLDRRVEYIIHTCSEKLGDRGKKDETGTVAARQDLGVYLLALCEFLSFDLRSTSSASTVKGAWEGVLDCKGNASLVLQYDATISLASAMAHCCSRGTNLPANDYVSQLYDKLSTLSLPTHALNGMRVDLAFCLADQTGDLRHLAFAENLRARASMAAAAEAARTLGEPDVGGSNSRISERTSFAGFCWDDGIGEWVMVSTASSTLPTAPPCRRWTRASLPATAGPPGARQRVQRCRDRLARTVLDSESDSAASTTDENESDMGTDEDGETQSTPATETSPISLAGPAKRRFTDDQSQHASSGRKPQKRRQTTPSPPALVSREYGMMRLAVSANTGADDDLLFDDSGEEDEEESSNSSNSVTIGLLSPPKQHRARNAVVASNSRRVSPLERAQQGPPISSRPPLKKRRISTNVIGLDSDDESSDDELSLHY